MSSEHLDDKDFLWHHTLFKLREFSLKHDGYMKIFFCLWAQVLFY